MPEKINFCWQYDTAHEYDLSNVKIIEEVRVSQARSFFQALPQLLKQVPNLREIKIH